MSLISKQRIKHLVLCRIVLSAVGTEISKLALLSLETVYSEEGRTASTQNDGLD